MPDFPLFPVDIPTLALSRALMQVMLAGLLVYVGGRHEHASGARLWAAGFLLNGLSLFLFSISAQGIWDTVCVVGNHLLLGAGSACLLLGFWTFGRQRTQTWLAMLVVAIPLTALLAFEVAWPNARLRVLTSAFGQVVFLLALHASLRRPPRHEIEHIYRRLRVLTLVYAAVLVWSYAAIADLLPTSARVDPGYHRALFSVASLLFSGCSNCPISPFIPTRTL